MPEASECSAHGRQDADGVDRELADGDRDGDDAAGLQGAEVALDGFLAERGGVDLAGIEEVAGDVDEVVAPGERERAGGREVNARVGGGGGGRAEAVGDGVEQHRVGLEGGDVRRAEREGLGDGEATGGAGEQDLAVRR